MSSTLIPEGFTFLNKDTFLSVKARKMVIDLLQQSDNRNPDAHDMYIYNDFYSYAVLDLVDKTLTKLHSKVQKKDWDEAMLIAEALTYYISLEDSFVGVDDGERIEITNTVYGALLVKTLREVKNQGRLDATHYPSLETFLKAAVKWNNYMKGIDCGASYGIICKAIGKRLFEGKSDYQKRLEKERLEEWLKTLDKKNSQDEDEDEDGEDDDDKEENQKKKEWFSTAKESDEDLKDSDLALSRVWKEYKDCLKGCPSGPMRGPSWDISSWREADKKAFRFDGEMGFEDEFLF